MVPCTDDDDDVLMVAMMMALKPLHLIGGAHDDVAPDDVVEPLVQLMHMVMVAMMDDGYGDDV